MIRRAAPVAVAVCSRRDRTASQQVLQLVTRTLLARGSTRTRRPHACATLWRKAAVDGPVLRLALRSCLLFRSLLFVVIVLPILAFPHSLEVEGIRGAALGLTERVLIQVELRLCGRTQHGRHMGRLGRAPRCGWGCAVAAGGCVWTRLWGAQVQPRADACMVSVSTARGSNVPGRRATVVCTWSRSCFHSFAG